MEDPIELPEDKDGWKKYHDKQGEERLWYGSKQWQSLRAMILAHYSMCVFCNDSPAEEVHHIEPAKNNKELFFVIKNLAPLCSECHIKVEKAYRRGILPIILFPLEKRLEDIKFI
jgi:5-methylcytosine-specific restriction endonuclease McrA